jgi:predicted nucleic acid-binding protein
MVQKATVYIDDSQADVELAFLDDLAAGTFVVDCLDRKELGVARDLARRYRDLEVGLAASLVVLADRHRTDRIASFDERAFRAMTPFAGRRLHDPPRGLQDAPRSFRHSPSGVPETA